MVTRRRGVKHTRRGYSKTSKHKQTYRNKSKNNRTTHRINMLTQDGGLRIFHKSSAKARWGKRIEKLVIQKLLTPEQKPGQLEQVLNLRNQEPNDIPARLYVDPDTGLNTNVSIKAKQQSKSKVVTIDAGYPVNILNTLKEDSPYHMIFVTYIMYGPKNRMSIIDTLKLDLKKIFSKLVPFASRATLLSDIQKLSALIKSKADDDGSRRMCQVITNKIARESKTNDVVWKINPKISTSNHRIQGTLTIDFDSPFVKSCIIGVGDTFDSLSSAESEDGADPRRWMSREPDTSMRGIVRPTPKSSVGAHSVASAASARGAQSVRSAQGLLKPSQAVKLTPHVLPSGRTSTSSRNRQEGIQKPSRLPRTPSFRLGTTAQQKLPSHIFEEEEIAFPSPAYATATASPIQQTFFQTANKFFRTMHSSPGDTQSDDGDM